MKLKKKNCEPKIRREIIDKPGKRTIDLVKLIDKKHKEIRNEAEENTRISENKVEELIMRFSR